MYYEVLLHLVVEQKLTVTLNTKEFSVGVRGWQLKSALGLISTQENSETNRIESFVYVFSTRTNVVENKQNFLFRYDPKDNFP